MVNDTTMCKIEGCAKPRSKRGWCSMHYHRWYRYGDPAVVHERGAVAGPVDERFWSKVDAMGVCWEWTKNTHKGYGRFQLDGKSVQAHRVSWELLVGPIPAGLQIDHRCRNTLCVNPDHLEPDTPRENTLRGVAAIRGPHNRQARKTHCPQNHEYTTENTYVTRDKAGYVRRQCVTCRYARNRARHRGSAA